MAKLNFLFFNRTSREIKGEFFSTLAQQILNYFGLDREAELSLILCDGEEITKLNKKYRGKNQITDVLAFGLGGEFPDVDILTLGDIFICIPQAERQARRYQHSLNKELAILFTHGLLHLLGYNHKSSKMRNKMEKLEKQIIDQFFN